MPKILALFALISLTLLPAKAEEPVAELQTILAARGCYASTVDGSWGPGTQKAVQAFSTASGLVIDRPISAEALAAASASNARCPVSKFIPLTSLPHPGEFFFNIDEVRARDSKPAASCSAPLNNFFAPPREVPAIKVAWGPGEPVDGNRFAIALMGTTSYLMRAVPSSAAESAKVESTKSLLLEWARADALRQFEYNNGRNWWAVYQAFPAILLTYRALDHGGMLSDDERKTIRTWMQQLVERTRIGVELNISGPYRPNDERINNKNTRRGLVALLWAIENDDVAMFNRAVESGYVRFLKTMRPDGSVPDANRGNWALAYSAFNIGAAMFLAEAAAHQGVDLYGMEIEGQSIHTAVKFLLDANEDTSIAGQYAGENAGMADKGAKAKYLGEQDPWWKFSTDYGVSLIGWLELYVSRFPDSENAHRLLLLARERKLHDSRPYYMDWGFGNVSCFWGNSTAAATAGAALEDVPANPLTFDAARIAPRWASETSEGFAVTLRNAVLDSQKRDTLLFTVIADYNDPSKVPDTIELLRISIETYSLGEKASREASYAECGEIAAQPGEVRLHYGQEASRNLCVLEKMGPMDRQIWSAVYAALPAILDATAATGSESAGNLKSAYAAKVE